MTRQEIFDTVSKHLLKQNKRSQTFSTCMYRGDGNTKCAIGCLIPDELYYPQIEFVIVNDDRIREILASTGIDINEDFLLLRRLQLIHDNESPEEWQDALSNLAKEFNLSFN